MVKIRGTIKILEDVTNRYGLRTLFLDFTDTTLISKIGVSQDIFIQIYANEKKDKINMALVVAGERVYGKIKREDFFMNTLLKIRLCMLMQHRLKSKTS